MKVKINNNAISIDVTGNPTLINLFGTTHATILKENIFSFNIALGTENGDVVEVVTTQGMEYFINHSLIIELNGVNPGFTSAIEVFDKVNELLCGL